MGFVRSSIRAGARWWLQPGGAWLTMLLLGGVVLWGCWERLDLQGGDTSVYFATGRSWLRNGHFSTPDELVFSPLYTIFYGLVQRSFSDAYAATIVHRLLIVAAAASAVLGLARAVLPRAWAWLLAAWWVVLPPNSYAYFEVHIFGFALVALGCWLAGAGKGPGWRGTGLAILTVTALTVRNEFVPAAFLFGAVCVGFEIRRARRGGQTWGGAGRALIPLFAPLTIAACLAAPLWFAEHKVARWEGVRTAFEKRHRVNLKQVYPYGYQQRQADWTGDPWREGGDLMKRDFGRADPTFGEAWRANPQAMVQHVLWNVKLLPAGLQLGLFGAHSGASTPDFAVTPGHSRLALGGGIALIVVVVAGLWGQRKRLWPGSGRAFPGAWTWVALICCLPTNFIAIVTQRPRPSYIFTLTLLVMLLALVGLRALMGRIKMPAWMRTALPQAAGVVLLAFAVGLAAKLRPQRRPLLEDYRRLTAHQRLFDDPAGIFVSNTEWSKYLINYLGRDKRKTAHGAAAPLNPEGAQDFAATLDKSAANLVYLKDDFLSRPDVRRWQAAELRHTWQVVASAQAPAAPWLLARRITQE